MLINWAVKILSPCVLFSFFDPVEKGMTYDENTNNSYPLDTLLKKSLSDSDVPINDSFYS